MERVLDKEEKEMDEADEADDEESETLLRDVEMIEEAMEEDIKEVSKMVKPVRQVLFKVRTHLFFLPWSPRGLGVFTSAAQRSFTWLSFYSFLYTSVLISLIPASETCIRNQEFDDYYLTSME